MILPLETRLYEPAATKAADSGWNARLRVLTDAPPGIHCAPGLLTISPGLESLDGRRWVEEWRFPGSGECIEQGAVRLLVQPDGLFAAWQGGGDSIQALAQRAYLELFTAIRAQGFPHPVRIWNYFPRIHDEECGLERYQSFCVGRAEALAELGIPDRNMPAATAIGTRAPDLFIYLIAARERSEPIENPRQVSAWDYPRQYSPRGPAFARATRVETASGPLLLLSGTASIIGHESRHVGDLTAQTREILTNVDVLRSAAGLADPVPAWLRVYLRDPADQPAVAAVLEAHYGSRAPLLQWVRGDVCRTELLVEFEGVHA
jgi:chorismate lyase / 3-hydroxybenzoate synthase